jgi:ribose/xylose/arabinose/galactoside ABC-type transport system permease subunit
MKKLAAAIVGYKIIPFFILAFTAVAGLNPYFLTSYNVSSLLMQMSTYGIAALGLSFLLIAGYLDIAMGSVIAFSGVLLGILMRSSPFLHANFIIPSGIVLLVCALTGLAISFFVTILEVDSFVVSLCAMTFLRGAALVMANRKPVPINSDAFAALSQQLIGPVPIIFILFFALVLISEYLLSWTAFGRNLFAIGGNREIAGMAGINTRINGVLAYVAYYVLAGVAGLVLASRMNSGTPIVGTDAPLSIIPMLILGGTALSGGKGGAIKTLFGCAFLSLAFNAMSLFGIPSNLQDMVKGAIILVIIVSGKMYENRELKV